MVMTPHCGDHSLSVDLTSDEISATGGRQRFALSNANILGTVDIRGETPPTRNNSKTGTTIKVIPIFDVEHRGVEPLFRNKHGRDSAPRRSLPVC